MKTCSFDVNMTKSFYMGIKQKNNNNELESESQKNKAVEQLLIELQKGKKSGEKSGWLTEDDIRTYFKEKK